MLGQAERKKLLGDDADKVGENVYLTDGRRLVEVRRIDRRGRIIVHNCANLTEESIFALLPAQMKKDWHLVRPQEIPLVA